MRTAAVAILTTLLIAPAATGPAAAGPNAGACLVLHVVESTGSDPCFASTPIPSCQGLNIYGPVLLPVYAYVLVEKGDATAGIGGARFGIDYDGAPGFGVNILIWTLCADSQVSSGWPAAGSGLEISWNPGNCQHRVSGAGDPFWDAGAAVIGYFYCAAYSPSQLSITPHPLDNRAVITDCSGTVDDITAGVPSHLGVAGFLAPGYNPCYMLDINPCGISGPAQCAAGSTGNQFVTDALDGNILWEITGNGTIVGPTNGQTVSVQAGGAGSFTLTCRSGEFPGGSVCGKVVTVEDAVPVQPATWSGIKALYRG